MYGIYKNQVAINNVDPAFGDGRSSSMTTTGAGASTWGCSTRSTRHPARVSPGTRRWTSTSTAPAEFSNLAPGLSTLLNNRGLLNANIEVGIKVPQQVMGSIFAQVNDRWAVLGSVGWQQWSKFGQVQLGIDGTTNPTSLTTDLDFKDTWHFALGAQYRISEPWLLNFGIAYDSGFQDGSNVSPLLPVNSAWRFGVGAQHQLSETFFWGVATEYHVRRDARYEPAEHGAGCARRAWKCGRFVRQHRNPVPRPVR